MNYKTLGTISGVVNMASGMVFALWWAIMGVMIILSGNFDITTLHLVQLPGYQLQSIIGLLACIVGSLGILGLYLPNAEKVGKTGFLGFVLLFVGVFLYGCMQFDETFTWPVLAQKAPSLLAPEGLMSDIPFLIMFILMGVILVMGALLFGLANYRNGIFPKWSIILFTFGAVFFGVGMSVIIRTLGLVMWVIGWIRMGQYQRKTFLA
jgi:hypothetical protein